VIARSCSIASLFFLENLPVSGKKQTLTRPSQLSANCGPARCYDGVPDTASNDGSARLWDASTGDQIGEPMLHQNRAYTAEFGPDGRRVVTASAPTNASGPPDGCTIGHCPR
jgi:WD40 repeat protein